ncbi:MAG: ABC transporter permease subunit [Oligoflexia bacterium]|nr:ABC transporter permease subunit [Oligoflexia bacterium]
MVEKFLKNTETIKRWKKLKSNKKTVIAGWIFLFFLFLSLTAEFWSNNKPIIMSYQGNWHLPALIHYHPSDLNLDTNLHVIDYKSLPFSKSDWAFWPLVKWDPFESNTKVNHYPSPPSADNWLGTDDRGRDILARLIYGFRYSIGFALVVWFLSYLFGTFLGAVMGFVGGHLDLIGQRCVEIIETVPFLLLLITLVDLMGGASFWLLVIFMACFRWINISYYIRAEFLKLRKREFVDVCHVQGMKPLRIMFKHILPNSLNPILTFSPFSLAAAISVLAILDYLGFGLNPPTPSWGELLLQAEKYFTVAWWLALFPSLALFTTLMVLTFIGDGIRTAFDPRKAN